MPQSRRLNFFAISLLCSVFLFRQVVRADRKYASSFFYAPVVSAEYPPQLDYKSLKDILWYSNQYELPSNEPYDENGVFTSDNDTEGNEIEDDYPFAGSMKKRDYNAMQLLKMLRQLATNRGRHRQIRISGKAVRFGISRK